MYGTWEAARPIESYLKRFTRRRCKVGSSNGDVRKEEAGDPALSLGYPNAKPLPVPLFFLEVLVRTLTTPYSY